MSAPAIDIVASALDRLAGEGPLGLACSGGGDSLALLLIASRWARQSGRPLHILTVDHCLRPESTGEARFVAETAARHGWPCDILRWDDARGGSGLQARARAARHRLLASAARRHRLSAVMLAHTRDDQDETVCMRLAAGGSWRSAAAMAERAPSPAWPEGREVMLVRPCLAVSRADLRASLEADGAAWIEDPSNQDAHYARIRTRQTLAQLNDRGFDTGRFAALATDLRAMLDAERLAAWQAARTCLRLHPWGAIDLAPDRWSRLPPVLRLTLLEAAVMAVSGQPASPSRARLIPLDGAILAGRPASGCGVLVRPGARVWLIRDGGAVSGRVDREPPSPWIEEEAGTAVFDGRFVIDGRARELEWRLLGDTYEGLTDRAILDAVPGPARSGLLVGRDAGSVVVIAGLGNPVSAEGGVAVGGAIEVRSLIEHRFCRRLLPHGAARWFDETERA